MQCQVLHRWCEPFSKCFASEAEPDISELCNFRDEHKHTAHSKELHPLLPLRLTPSQSPPLGHVLLPPARKAGPETRRLRLIRATTGIFAFSRRLGCSDRRIALEVTLQTYSGP